jgi:hypothetical protein
MLSLPFIDQVVEGFKSQPVGSGISEPGREVGRLGVVAVMRRAVMIA